MSRVFLAPKYKVTQTYEQHVKVVEASLANPKENPKKYARGIDLVSQFAIGISNILSKVIAHSDGTVIYASNGLGGYGNVVIVAHANGYCTAYGHLKSMAVGVNQKVSKGAILGVIGNTGASKGIHLHFEVRKYPKVMTSQLFNANIWGGFDWVDPTGYVDADLPGCGGGATPKALNTGDKFVLNNVTAYGSEKGASIGMRSGTYYVWGVDECNGRIKMTNSSARVGVRGQVSFFVDKSVLISNTTVTTTTATYTVVKGDSLWNIAAKKLGSGARYKEIMTLNGLKSDILNIGQVLKLPTK